MLENFLKTTNLEKLDYEIEQSTVFINEVKEIIGKPSTKLEYYGTENFRKVENVLEKLEKHYYFDEMYFIKMVGLLESLHIHLFSDYIIYNKPFKEHIFSSFEVLSNKGHMTGYISDNGFTGEKNVRFNSDQGFTDYVATRFFPKSTSIGCLGAISLLSEKTLNEKVYDKIFSVEYRKKYISENFEEINQLHIAKNGKSLFFFKCLDDFINISELISELRNRTVHRNFGYDFSSIVEVKNEKFSNFKKKSFWEGQFMSVEEMFPNKSAKEIKIIKEKSYDDDDLHINESLIEYLKEKELIKDSPLKNYFPYTDNNILQLLSKRMKEIVLESVFIHKCMYDKFINELVKSA
ncbi:hypothetical protein [Tenacibaculum dicentrarchi]|uniref:hypothetical protein n=1 Tax=Tenacibaculum dicentrarchi TaxID=669041 RepID=UPI003518B77C